MKDPGAQLIKLEVARTAHVYKLGNRAAPSGWMVTHGYGMLAEKFIRKFEVLDQDQHKVYAPEALSKFYWHEQDRVPVGSWMTRRHRLDEIQDYCNYLHTVYKNLDNSSQKILLGFSQGGTTMLRYIHAKRPDFNAYINWAGDVPEDIAYSEMQDYLSGKKLIYVYGDNDKYFTEEKVTLLKARCQKFNLPFEFVKFSGTHKVEKSVLIDLVKNFDF